MTKSVKMAAEIITDYLLTPRQHAVVKAKSLDRPNWESLLYSLGFNGSIKKDGEHVEVKVSPLSVRLLGYVKGDLVFRVRFGVLLSAADERVINSLYSQHFNLLFKEVVFTSLNPKKVLKNFNSDMLLPLYTSSNATANSRALNVGQLRMMLG